MVTSPDARSVIPPPDRFAPLDGSRLPFHRP
jgi:hypothetical protein